MKKMSFQEKQAIELEILEDPYMIAETKLALIWMLRKDKKGELTRKEALNNLHISQYKWNIVRKQLKELDLIKLEDL